MILEYRLQLLLVLWLQQGFERTIREMTEGIVGWLRRRFPAWFGERVDTAEQAP